MKRLRSLLLAACLLAALFGCANQKAAPVPAAPQPPESAAPQPAVRETVPTVMVGGTLYFETGLLRDGARRCGVMDGEITSSVGSGELPTQNGQSNFGDGYGYQSGEAGTIELLMDGHWHVFAAEEAREASSYGEPSAPAVFTAVVTHVGKKTMLVRPAEDAAERLCADSFCIGLGAITDNSLPQVGDTYRIAYGGAILETYPAQLEGIADVSRVSPEPVPALKTLPGMIVYGAFSLQEDAEQIRSAGFSVRTDGFVNTEAVGPADPVSRARAEADAAYDLAQSFYDAAQDVWKVRFFRAGEAGGETVYFDGSGVTALVVYGVV